MSELSKPKFNLYGLALGQKPILAIGVETGLSTIHRANEKFADQISGERNFPYVDIHASRITHQVAIGILGWVQPLFEV